MATENAMNMRVLEPSRKRVRAGDVFTYQLPDMLFRFGRVIKTSCAIANWSDVLLVYFYCATSSQQTLVPRLHKHELLIPPVGTNGRGWTRGYFKTVARLPLAPEDILECHCFEEAWSKQRRYWDEDGNRLRKRVEPCGDWAVSSCANIDADIMDALGSGRGLNIR